MGRTIAVVGISGVGKSTFLFELQKTVRFQLLTASSLIKDQKRAIEQGSLTSEELRLANIGDNQLLLVDGFHRKRDIGAEIVVLDGHTVVDTPNGLIEISSDIFNKIGIETFIFLMERPELIADRRAGDSDRTRPNLSVEKLQQHQNLALTVAARAALTMRVPLIVITSDQIQIAVDEFQKSKA